MAISLVWSARKKRVAAHRSPAVTFGVGDFVDLAYRLILARPADADGLRHFAAELESGRLNRDGFLRTLADCEEARALRDRGLDWTTGRRWLDALHAARCRLIAGLPSAAHILDLGGSAEGHPEGAMVAYGYPHRFESLTILDLPRDLRHPIYHDICGEYPDVIPTAQGPVRYVYTSMADLAEFADASFDLVFSGESIEHVSRSDAARTLAEVRRVLRPGGQFCLDTPNRAVTRLEFPDSWINPDHEHEYTHDELSSLLRSHGFVIERAAGVGLFAQSVASGRFDYNEGIRNAAIFDDIERCYLLFYACRKPGD